MTLTTHTKDDVNHPKVASGLTGKFYPLVCSLVLLGLGGWLLLRLFDGSLSYYLHPRFNPLIALTGLVILFLGGGLFFSRKTRPLQKEATSLEMLTGLALVGLVAFVGLVVTPQPLDNSRLNLSSTKGGVAVSGGNTNRALAQALLKQDWKDASTLDTVRWSLLDWSAALNDPQRAEKLEGRSADVVGFVIRPKGENNRYFLVARYVVVCCTADSSALRVPVISDAASNLEEGQWVRVRGVLGQGSNGAIAFLAKSVDTIERPAQPYIFP